MYAGLVRAYPLGAFTVKKTIKEAIYAASASGDFDLLRAFGPCASAVFEVYEEWRQSSRADIRYGEGDQLPCEPLVQLYLDLGIDKEFLLGQAFTPPFHSLHFCAASITRNLSPSPFPTDAVFTFALTRKFYGTSHVLLNI